MNVIRILVPIFLSFVLTCNSSIAQENHNNRSNEQSSGVDLTEIVVTALVLGFGYSVLQSFKSKDK